MKTKEKVRYKGVQATAIIVLAIVSILIILPFLLMLISSLTEENTLMINGYRLLPKQFSLDAYRYIFLSTSMIVSSYGRSALVTLVGTICALTITCLMAYPLSRRDFRFRKVLSFLVFFTMLFNGGLVSQYMMWTTIFHIKNTVFAYLVPNLMMSAFNVMIVRNFFSNNIPFEIIESATIDGSGEWNTFFKIVLPMAKPILATIGLMIGLAYWNDWANGLYYINDSAKYTFQNLLNRMIQQVNFLSSGEAAQYGVTGITIPSISVRMAIAAVGVIPVMIIYPFFQKYFAKGLTMGAVKG